MIKKLIKLANHLDKKGFSKEADYLDVIIKKSYDCKSKADDMEGNAISPEYDEEMKERGGFSKKQIENLPDEVQKELLEDDEEEKK